MTATEILSIFSRLAHLGAVIIAVGGAFFMYFVLLPAASSALDESTHDRLREDVRRRWARFVHGAIALILVSGLFNAYDAVTAGASTAYLVLFVIKFAAALGVFFLASALVGRSAAFEPLRRQARSCLGLIVGLAALIIVLAAVMHAMPKAT